MTAGTQSALKPDLNPHPHSYPILTHLRASPPRTSLHAQALLVGEGKGETPALQETHAGSLCALPNRLPLPKLIDTVEAIDALPSYDSFEPSPDDF